jgi:signal transduction histidine kinase
MVIAGKNGIWQNKRMRRIAYVVIIAFFIILGVLSSLFYFYSYSNFVDSELTKLQGISNTVAMQLDANQHETLVKNHPDMDDILSNNQDSNYQAIYDVLVHNQKAYLLSSPLYTLIKSKSGQYVFGVTSNEAPYFRHEYSSSPASMFKLYKNGGTISPYRDEFGEWLTAFTPLKNSEGNTVALIMADEKLENFNKKVQFQLLSSVGLAALIFTLMYGLLVYIMQGILVIENKDKLLLQKTLEENKSIQSDLQLANSKLDNINTLRKEMIANLSHDLRTPLATTIGYLELIQKDNIDQKAKDNYTNIAYKESLRIKKMVADLFEISKMESGNVLLQKEDFNIIDLVSDVMMKNSLAIEVKHLKSSKAFDSDHININADLALIERVIQNLLENAIKYTHEGGFINVTVHLKDDHLMLKVCNSGDEIAKDELYNIFERYYKSTTNFNPNSTGLGLNICLKICELHGGNMHASSIDGINSFWFIIPSK